MLTISPTGPAGIPPIWSASGRVTSLPAGIHVGLGSPCPCLVTSRSPSRPFLRRTVSELSSDCMTSTMIVRSDHPRTQDGAPPPPPQQKRPRGVGRVPHPLAEPLHPARRARPSVGHPRREQP